MRGSIAKEQVEKKIIEAFGDDYVGTIDKKISINMERIVYKTENICYNI